MIEFIVLIILIIVFAFLIYSVVSIPVFLINLSLLIIIALRAKLDLKENKMHVYYMTAAFLAIIVFIASTKGFLSRVLDLLSSVNILSYTQAAIIIFILAHLIGFSHSTIKDFTRDLKQKRHKEKAASPKKPKLS